MPEVETYYQRAPYSYERYDRVNKERMSAEQASRLVAYEVCDGGDGRCKCEQRCVRAVIERTEPLQPDAHTVMLNDIQARLLKQWSKR